MTTATGVPAGWALTREAADRLGWHFTTLPGGAWRATRRETAFDETGRARQEMAVFEGAMQECLDWVAQRSGAR